MKTLEKDELLKQKNIEIIVWTKERRNRRIITTYRYKKNKFLFEPKRNTELRNLKVSRN